MGLMYVITLHIIINTRPHHHSSHVIITHTFHTLSIYSKRTQYLHPHAYLYIIAYVLVCVLVAEDLSTMYDEGGIIHLMSNGRKDHPVLSISKSHITKVKPALSQV